MFCIGDKIVYGSMGVCTVVDVGVPDLPDALHMCYTLKPDYVANSKVYAPIENNPVSMRALLSPKEAQSLIDSMPQIEPFPPGEEKQQLLNTYRSAIRSADIFILARLLKTLHAKRQLLIQQKKMLSSVEKEYFGAAEKMFFGELAATLKIAVDAVPDYIAARIGSAEQVAS
ncbi:MAG: CarD family transcriptional regulator [Oscillospiraceae bacterium]